MRFRNIFFLLSAAIGMQACSTELDVNAPSRETKVVYCVLDPSLSFQTARISRGFLSEGRSAYELAQIADSNLYNPANLEVNLLELRRSSTGRFDTVGRYLMRADTINTKDTESGDFYGPEQLVYRTDNFNLGATSNPDLMKYCLRVRNKISGKVSEAYTQVPGSGLRIQNWAAISINGTQNGPYSLDFGSLKKTTVGVLKSENTAVMQLIISWKIAVITSTDSTIEYWQLKSGLENDIQGNQQDFIFLPGSFWSFIQTELSRRGSQGIIRRRIIQNVQAGDLSDMEIFAANQDYDNYRLVNGNFNAVTQSQPIYTNFNNGALGIFAAKNKVKYKVALDRPVLDSLNLRFPEFKLKL